MKNVFQAVWLALFIATPAMAAEGLIDVQSAFSVAETADRLENVLNEKGMTIFKRVKHSEAAGKIGVRRNSSSSAIPKWAAR